MSEPQLPAKKEHIPLTVRWMMILATVFLGVIAGTAVLGVIVSEPVTTTQTNVTTSVTVPTTPATYTATTRPGWAPASAAAPKIATSTVTILDVIRLTRDESGRRYPSTITWVDTNPDSDLVDMADAICSLYESMGDKDRTLGYSTEAYFNGWAVIPAADLDMFYFFGDSVIDLLCND